MYVFVICVLFCLIVFVTCFCHVRRCLFAYAMLFDLYVVFCMCFIYLFYYVMFMWLLCLFVLVLVVCVLFVYYVFDCVGC